MRVEKQVETRVKTPDQVLSLLANQPTLTLADIAAYLGKSPSTIERSVAKLKQQKRLAFHGPKKGGYWQVLDNKLKDTSFPRSGVVMHMECESWGEAAIKSPSLTYRTSSP
ncbi:ArsR family transcriptional regulator [Salinivibrio sp. MA440]|uniref:ArsR family transcriptional regulator n=1 Tax=Salinivibrio sp. MA440 TaxID=1909456 RepID=UPI0018E2C67E|nr:ArsR family transcriptional regulator [Salinivibrio sp. MA440]